MSGQSDLSTAVQATKLGAYNFLEKPLNPDQLILELRNIESQKNLERKMVSLESWVGREQEIIGHSEAIISLRKAIVKAAPSEGRILISGENGTGKELVAVAIHRQGLRKKHPFVGINCAALPSALVESELFGYEKGAFTGAVKRKAGLFEIADGGTLFLDEICDMGLETQAKLLRVMEQNEAVRVGGSKPYRFNVRFISATNKNLAEEIEKGRFREDLFYRINVIPLEVPPLRDHLEDIPDLANHFLKNICGKTGKGTRYWGEGVMDVLKSYRWPGNVRELRNIVERLIIMSEGKTIEPEAVERVLPTHSPYVLKEQEFSMKGKALSLKALMANFEKKVLRRHYSETGGNVSQLARKLRVDRANLHRKLKKYGIK
jgi:two-component system nitrogen regulation response regulator NtrX